MVLQLCSSHAVVPKTTRNHSSRNRRARVGRRIWSCCCQAYALASSQGCQGIEMVARRMEAQCEWKMKVRHCYIYNTTIINNQHIAYLRSKSASREGCHVHDDYSIYRSAVNLGCRVRKNKHGTGWEAFVGVCMDQFACGLQRRTLTRRERCMIASVCVCVFVRKTLCLSRLFFDCERDHGSSPWIRRRLT